MNKKAFIFSISLVLITLAALVSLFIVIGKIEKQTDPLRNIGERSIELLHVNKEAEKLQFFIEQAASITAEKAFLTLQETAGVPDKKCGVIQTYVYWNNPATPSEFCVTTNIYDLYQTYFNQNLDPYLKKLADDQKQELPLNNYDLFIQDGKTLTGIPSQPVQFTLFSPKEKVAAWTIPLVRWSLITQDVDPAATGNYIVKPSFTIPFNHDFSSFKTLTIFARQAFEKCKEAPKENQQKCVQDIKNNLHLDVQQQSDTFIFTSTDPQFPIKFALIIPTPPIQPTA